FLVKTCSDCLPSGPLYALFPDQLRGRQLATNSREPCHRRNGCRRDIRSAHSRSSTQEGLTNFGRDCIRRRPEESPCPDATAVCSCWWHSGQSYAGDGLGYIRIDLFTTVLTG